MKKYLQLIGDLFFEEGDISQNKGNNSQPKSDGGSSSGVVEINSWLHNESSRNLNATNKDNIANSRWLVNQKKNFSLVGLGEIEGTITTAPSQPAARLTNKSEITDRSAGFIDSTKPTLAKAEANVNEFAEEPRSPFGSFSAESGISTGFLSESDPHKKKCVDKQYSNKRHSDIYFLNKILQIINSHFSNISSTLIASSKDTIQRAMLIVNNQRLPIAGNVNKKNPAATLTKNEETTLNRGLENNFPTTNNFNI